MQSASSFPSASVTQLRPICLFWTQGGDVSANSMHMLHTQRGLAESVEIIRGICMGGFDTAKAAVDQGRASAQDFK